MSTRSGSEASSLQVLVVDDDAPMRSALVALVETFRVDVRGAEDGEAAHRLILERPPDLILCDLEMPTLDGLGFVRRLRRDPRHGRILTVAMSEAGERVDAVRTRRAGFDGHVAKPVSAIALALLLDRALDRHRTLVRDEGA